MELLAPMYHYVLSEADGEFSGMHHVSLRAFERQLGSLLRTHEPVDLQGALDFLSGRPWGRVRQPLLLTFDDGLRCHYERVYPLLLAKGLPAVFFIITATLERGRIPFVHRTHLLRNRLGDQGLRGRFLEALGRRRGPLDVDKLAPLPLASQLYRWDSPQIKQFKYLVNFVLSDEEREGIVGSLFREFFEDEREVANRLFVGRTQLEELARGGMEIGGHSHQHKALAGLTEQECQADIGQCVTRLEEVLGSRVRAFSYPYGKADTFNDAVVRVLRSSGVECCFSTIVGRNAPGQDRYAIRRVDPKDVSS